MTSKYQAGMHPEMTKHLTRKKKEIKIVPRDGFRICALNFDPTALLADFSGKDI